MKKLSVILPVYNEEKRIETAIKKIRSFLKHNPEIIVVDDGSTDTTLSILKRLEGIKIIHYHKNKGKGYAVKKGIQKAKNPLIIFMDADLSTSLMHVPEFIKKANHFDIIIGSRNLKKSKITTFQTPIRIAMGKLFPLLVNLFVIRGIKDTQCGFKIFRKKAAKKISHLQRINRFCFDVEMVYIAKKLNYKVKESPVEWTDRKGSKIRILKDSLSMLFDLFRIRAYDFLGKYNQKQGSK